MKANIVLTGFMGCGKTAVGRELARLLRVDYYDCDSLIENDAGMTISEIFEKHGESHFRLLEQNMILKLSGLNRSVISCGGGAVMNPENVKALKVNGILVFLKASPKVIYERLRNDSTRPLLKGRMDISSITRLYIKRLPVYLANADITVDSDGDSLRNICDEILEALQLTG